MLYFKTIIKVHFPSHNMRLNTSETIRLDFDVQNDTSEFSKKKIFCLTAHSKKESKKEQSHYIRIQKVRSMIRPVVRHYYCYEKKKMLLHILQGLVSEEAGAVIIIIYGLYQNNM